MYEQIKTCDLEMGLLVSKWNPGDELRKVLIYIVQDNKNCKIIQHTYSVETVLLKYEILNIY